MMAQLCIYTIIIYLIFTPVSSVRIKGTWSTEDDRINILAKFGFQKTRAIDRANSHGYVYGNITSMDYSNSSSPILLVLVPFGEIGSFRKTSAYGESCSYIMKNLSLIGYESRCFNNGSRGDLFRWIPCASDEFCKDEDNPTAVISNHQFTLQVEEPIIPEYWYLVLVSCTLNEKCDWVPATTKITLDYDIWMTNGKPDTDAAHPFTFNFSFDEQGTIPMLSGMFALYLLLFFIISQMNQYNRQRISLPRTRLLTYVVGLKTVGIGLQLINLLIFAFDGEGLIVARFFGEILRFAGIQLFYFLLILLARGWSFTNRKDALSHFSLFVWAIFAGVNFVFFLVNLVFVYDALHEVDVFMSWPGFGILFMRILFSLWFLIEVRSEIMREHDEDQAVFLAHFGAGFLVWFSYLPGLGVIASFISPLWRLKTILGITAAANFTALACMTHLFWPTSSYRKNFLGDQSYHRRVGRGESHEMADFERLLFESEDSDNDLPEIDPNINLHSI